MNTATPSTDRIEKHIDLKAPRSRVWRALTDAKEFGTWFNAALEGDFVVGQTTHGRMLYPGFEHLRLEMEIVAIQPETYFALRWHPYPIDPQRDYSVEPTTLIEFTLEERGTASFLRVVESGFDALPADRRSEAFPRNEGGWEDQLDNIRAYVERT